MAVPKSAKTVHHDIMLSSTFRDLKEHRAAVREAITRMGLFPKVMENDSARPEDLIESSPRMMDAADAYVGILGYRYGQIPECADRNARKLSLTELEYNRAEERGLPICMFVMSDEHPVPKKELDSVSDEEKRRLAAFRERVEKSYIYKEFDSVADLEKKAVQSLAELRDRLNAGTGQAPPVPAPKTRELVAMPPYTPGHEFDGRVKELQILSDWAVAATDPVLILEAIGGMGKSMLCWQWVTEYARSVRPDFAGVFWYSFYERGAEMNDFCRYAMAYMTGRPVEDFGERKTSGLAGELIALFRERPWLIALDGLERVLVAYNRYDAAQVRDEEIDDAKTEKAAACIRRADAELLRLLAGAGPSKFLCSSRLMPSALLNKSGVELPGVTHVKLTGLDPSDAELMMRRMDVKGDSARIRRYLEKNFGCHPLVVGVVAGLIRKYSPAPGDFDKWSEAADAGASVNLAEMDLVQRRNHILNQAFEDLTPAVRMLLARIALVSESVDYVTLVELNPVRAEQTKPNAEKWLAIALQDLDARGLVQWDRKNNTYDLHPVVRGYAISSIAHEDQSASLRFLVADYTTIGEVL